MEHYAEHREKSLLEIGMNSAKVEAYINDPVKERESDIKALALFNYAAHAKSGITVKKDIYNLEAVKNLISNGLIEFVAFNNGKDFITIRAK